MANESKVEEPWNDARAPKDRVGNVVYRIVWLMVFVAIPIYIVLRLTVL